MALDQTERSSKRLPQVVYVMGAAIFLLGTTEFMIAGLLPLLSDSLRVSLPRAGLLITGFAVGMLVGAPVMAVLTLRLPRRTTLAGALTVFAAGHVLAAVTSSYLVVLVARVVTAVATGAFWAVAAVVVSAAAGPAVRARALGVLIGGLTVATVAGVPLGTWVGETFGWRTPFWILAGAALLAAAAVLPLVPRQARTGDDTDLRAELLAFRSGRLWLGLGTIIAMQTGVFGAFSYFAPLLTDRAGLPDGAVPIALALFGVGALVGSQAGGRFADAHPWPTLYIGLTGATLSLAAIALFARTPAAALVLVTLLGVTAFSTAPPLNARVIGLAGPAPTLASAATTSAFNVGNAVGPSLGGAALGAYGLGAPAVVGTATVAVAVLLGLLSRRADRGQHARTTPPATTERRRPSACLPR